MGDAGSKIVLVGCGSMAQVWAELTQKAGDAQLVGLVDLNRAAAEKLAKHAGLSQEAVFDSLAEAVKRTGAEVVFDVTVPDAHATVSTEALMLGCHVLSEKPLAADMAGARKILAAAEKAGKLHAVMQNRRYMPEIRAVRQAVHAGAVGKLEEVHTDFFLGPHFGGFRDEMEFPLLVDMAIHTFDAARYVTDADPKAVYCHSFNPGRSWYKGDASAIAIFEMSDGLMFCYRGSWCAEGVPTSWESSWRLIGRKGSIVWDGAAEIKVQRVAEQKDFFHPVEDVAMAVSPMAATGHEGCIHDFLRCVREGDQPMTRGTDNVKSLAMVRAAVASAKRGERVAVEI